MARIVQTPEHSPKKYTIGCQQDSGKRLPLTAFIGPDGQAQLLAFLDVGEYSKSEQSHTSVKHMREFVEFARRVSMPQYEEARLYWSESNADGSFEGMRETLPYIQRSLKRIIAEYSVAS